LKYHHGDLRAALLEEAEKLLEQQGAEQLTLRDIARTAGVSHGAPAHHFGNKQGLFTALAVIVIGRMERQLRRALKEVDAADRRAQLVALATAYVDFAHENPELFLLHTHPKLLDYSNPEFQQARTELGGLIDQVLDAACAEGWLDRDDLKAARFAFMALVRGYGEVLTGGLPHYMAETPEEGAKLVADGALPAIELVTRSILHPPKGFRGS